MLFKCTNASECIWNSTHNPSLCGMACSGLLLKEPVWSCPLLQLLAPLLSPFMLSINSTRLKCRACQRCTHSPAQHDLCVTDGVRGWNVRSDHRTVCHARAGLWHLIRLRGDAVGTLSIHVYGYDPEPVDGAWQTEKHCYSPVMLRSDCSASVNSELWLIFVSFSSSLSRSWETIFRYLLDKWVGLASSIVLKILAGK